MNSGRGFEDLSKWYKTMHFLHLAPYKRITLQDYRSVFVSDRMENPEVPGPSNEGAAVIMGNSVRTWEATYWKNKRMRQAKQAAKEMGKYRDHHLKAMGYDL
jgi:hypothetical protein